MSKSGDLSEFIVCQQPAVNTGSRQAWPGAREGCRWGKGREGAQLLVVATLLTPLQSLPSDISLACVADPPGSLPAWLRCPALCLIPYRWHFQDVGDVVTVEINLSTWGGRWKKPQPEEAESPESHSMSLDLWSGFRSTSNPPPSGGGCSVLKAGDAVMTKIYCCFRNAERFIDSNT